MCSGLLLGSWVGDSVDDMISFSSSLIRQRRSFTILSTKILII
jgi:hypothetical protein